MNDSNDKKNGNVNIYFNEEHYDEEYYDEEEVERKGIKKLLVILGIVIIIGIGTLLFLSEDDIIRNAWNDIACAVNTIYMDISKNDEEILPYWYNFDENSLYKPVIYLYPKKEIEVDITLEGADLTTTYPEYNNGWSIVANPDGTIVDKNGREYNYLYWEGVSDYFVDMSMGFVVFKDNYIEFLEEKLGYIGLTDKESCDFITYWLPQMNEFEYCLVSFQMENYEEQVKLNYSVTPDNELRVFVAFKGLDKSIEIEEQDLSYYDSFERIGFTAVEWGGTFID